MAVPGLIGAQTRCRSLSRHHAPSRRRYARANVYGRRVLWLRITLVSVGLLIASWAVLVTLARRLPPGLLKDLAGILPACAATMWRLRRNPRVPRRAKAALVFAGLWVISPIDLIPEFLPVIGPLDDIVVVAIALRYAARKVPREVLEEAWPAEPRLLDRLLSNHSPDPSS
jgi:uncharacterized membrane protein YkvA (DUF1232 family)